MNRADRRKREKDSNKPVSLARIGLVTEDMITFVDRVGRGLPVEVDVLNNAASMIPIIERLEKRVSAAPYNTLPLRNMMHRIKRGEPVDQEQLEMYAGFIRHTARLLRSTTNAVYDELLVDLHLILELETNEETEW